MSLQWNLSKRLQAFLKENEKVVPPEWAENVKTGVHKELPPTNDDWWYIRCAAILRKIYTDGRPIGIERLRSVYGGKKDRGSRPGHKAKAAVRLPERQYSSLRLQVTCKR